MHTYEQFWIPDATAYPKIGDFRFRSPLDVAAWAQEDRLLGSKGGAEIWHLDDEGSLRCYSPGSTLDTLTDWASDPQRLYRSRSDGLAAGKCPARWLLVESRPGWLVPQPAPTNQDVDAFEDLVELLSAADVELVDAMIFDDECHWWSMREIAMNEQAWPTSQQIQPLHVSPEPDRCRALKHASCIVKPRRRA